MPSIERQRRRMIFYFKIFHSLFVVYDARSKIAIVWICFCVQVLLLANSDCFLVAIFMVKWICFYRMSVNFLEMNAIASTNQQINKDTKYTIVSIASFDIVWILERNGIGNGFSFKRMHKASCKWIAFDVHAFYALAFCVEPQRAKPSQSK